MFVHQVYKVLVCKLCFQPVPLLQSAQKEREINAALITLSSITNSVYRLFKMSIVKAPALCDPVQDKLLEDEWMDGHHGNENTLTPIKSNI